MTIMKRDDTELDFAAVLSASNDCFAKLLQEYTRPTADIIPIGSRAPWPRDHERS